VHVLLVESRPLNIVRGLALRVITGVHQPNHVYNEYTGDETPAWDWLIVLGDFAGGLGIFRSDPEGRG
jgi:hypothetical protein